MHDDLVRRAFTADRRIRLWLAGITEHATGEGKLYLCAVKDAFSNRIVGCSIDARMKSRPAVAALDNDARVTTLMPPWDTAIVERYAAGSLSSAATLAMEEGVAVYQRILADGGVIALGTDAPLTPIGLHLHLGLRRRWSPASSLIWR